MPPSDGLSADERDRLAELRAARRLADLVALTNADSEHDAYFAAKREWRDLRERELANHPPADGGAEGPDDLPGASVVLGGREFHVHGVTHADTDAERTFLREHVSRLLDAGAAVYCEQGVRRMYFADFPGVRAMDDYSWAMAERERRAAGGRDGNPTSTGDPAPPFDGPGEAVDVLLSRLRTTAFSLVEAGDAVYSDAFAAVLGDLASALLASHEDAATGGDFESFALTRAAATDPAKLRALQRYYEVALLPQPVEREWLRRHDPELELLTYARNERMADYLVYHGRDGRDGEDGGAVDAGGGVDSPDEEGAVHAIVGAAHQPGVAYYLERHRDGRRSLAGFAPVG